MKNGFLLFGLVAACLPLIARGTTLQSDAETPLYSNVQVVSIDAALRVIVIRDAKGRKESLVFDDLLASSGSIRAGDRVIVTVLGGPGRRRVSAIALAGITPAPSAIKARVPGPAITGAERMAAREMFARQVAAASQDARSLDASWASFVTACDVRQPENLSGGRASY